MAEHNRLYQQAVYYDIAMSREVDHEVAFLEALYQHHTGRPVQSVLDIACGPGYHAQVFARRGVRSVGLDLRPEMIQFAQDKAAEAGLTLEWMAADMRDFQLDSPVDLAVCVFDGIDALLANEDIKHHFQAVARNLTAGGLYVIEHTHPRDCSLSNYGTYHYQAQKNGVAVEITWATNSPYFDLASEVAYVETQMIVNDNGTQIIINDSAQERLFSPQQMILLAELSGALNIVGWYGDFNLLQPFDNSPGSRRMIVVMQKTEAEP